jgi:NADH:ubiquinone oxidoreductase subunit 6 (subunit J)
MSATQNLSYAVIQVVHNFGAVAVVGGSLIALRVRERAARRKLGYLALAGWLTQAASGATFGIVTYYYHRQLPDIAGIATYALGIKMLCATLGIVMLAAYLWRAERWTEQGRNQVWLSSSALAITALSAAAFLRWFS